mgnify:CR=1 FL=1
MPRGARVVDAPMRLRSRDMLIVHLPYPEPFDWPGILRFLAARLASGVESVEGEVYARTLRRGEDRGWLRLRPAAEPGHLELAFSASFAESEESVCPAIARLFDLGADMGHIGAQLGRDPALAPLVQKNPGMRLVSAFDPFELALRAILSQQISVKAASTFYARLAQRFGKRFSCENASLRSVFPTPGELAASSPADIAAIGLSRARAQTIQRFAIAVAEGKLNLDATRELDTLLAELQALPGVGPWTAHYIAMRGLGMPDAFPSGDLGLQRAMGGLSAAALTKRAERWRPWRAYAAIHLWNQLGGG